MSVGGPVKADAAIMAGADVGDGIEATAETGVEAGASEPPQATTTSDTADSTVRSKSFATIMTFCIF
jgi:hypothetical protein